MRLPKLLKISNERKEKLKYVVLPRLVRALITSALAFGWTRLLYYLTIHGNVGLAAIVLYLPWLFFVWVWNDKVENRLIVDGKMTRDGRPIH